MLIFCILWNNLGISLRNLCMTNGSCKLEAISKLFINCFQIHNKIFTDVAKQKHSKKASP